MLLYSLGKQQKTFQCDNFNLSAKRENERERERENKSFLRKQTSNISIIYNVIQVLL